MWRWVGLFRALTMPEPLQLWQCWTLVPGSWPLPSQRRQAASILMDISLFTPFAAWVNVSSMTYCVRERKTDINCTAQAFNISRCKDVHLKYSTNLLWLIKYSIEIPKPTTSWEFPKDLAEELLGIHVAGLSCPVVVPSTGLPCIKASGAIRVVLFPLYFITQDLWETFKWLSSPSKIV